MTNSQSNCGAKPEEWLKFQILGHTGDLLPVVSNRNAVVSPNSGLKAIGKVPSRYDENRQVVGISGWTQKQVVDAQVDFWAKEPDYGICIQTRDVRALDIDVPDRALAHEISEFIQDTIYLNMPLRFRSNSGKCLLAFRLQGQWPKRKMDVQGGIIEFLGNGQQFIAAGTHPSGARYEWRADSDFDGFPEISAEQFEMVWAALVSKYAIGKVSISTGLRQTGEDLNIDDPRAEFLRNHAAYLGQGPTGEILFECPYKHEHTGDSGPSETVYFPAGTNGYPDGHYVCLHAHCQGRGDGAFDLALGFHDGDFEVCSADQWGELAPQADTQTASRFKPIQAGDFLSRPRPGWIIKGLLPKAEVAAIYGESTAGKSFVCIDMGMSIARGLDWLGLTTQQGRVVYIVAEGAGGFRNRLEAYGIRNEIDLASVPFDVVPAAPNFLDIKDPFELAKEIGKAHVIFVDTLAQTIVGANENAAEGLSKAISHCKKLSTATGALVVLVHHAGKDLERGLRGWSGLKGALDANLEVLKGDGEVRTLRVEKLKDGKETGSWSFILADVELPQDDPLEETEVAAVVEFVGPSQEKKKRVKKLRVTGDWPNLVLDVFHKISPDWEPVFAPLFLEKALAYAKVELPKKGRELDCIRRAIYGLKTRGVLIEDENRSYFIAQEYQNG